MVATPGTPPNRIKTLREAYNKALKEPEVVVGAMKRRLDLQSVGGEELEAWMREIVNQPPEVIERVKKLVQ